ncbi:hypothetical protein L6R52_03195 [Myxococcota bacterium]|nr:hypothetical protein [Myxococcota bacterium]
MSAVSACGEDGEPFVPPPPAEIGSARVTWRIESTAGAPIACSELGIETTMVLFGGKQVIVPCGQPEEAVFENLLPDRYSVIVQLRRVGSGFFDEQVANVVVVADQQATAEFVFEYDRTSGTGGGLSLAWTIDGEDPVDACSAVGGARVRVTSRPGSREDFRAEVPCTDGSVVVEDLPAGTYGVLFQLLDADDAIVATASLVSVEVFSGEISVPLPVSFTTGVVQRATFFAAWTVNSTTAAAGCVAADAETMIIKAFPDNVIVPTLTATVACTAGQVTVSDVVPGPRRHRITFQLFRGLTSTPPLPVIVTSTTVRDVYFARGETSSVSVNLRSLQ